MKATKMSISEAELAERLTALKEQIERLLPDFAKSCTEKEVLVIHQDAFSADYQQSEYALLGMAIKYAGLHGKEVRIIGTNRETLKETGKPLLVQ